MPNYTGNGAGFLTDYSGLAAAGSAFQGFADSYQKAQDSQMKRQEHEAQMEALKAKMQREADQSEIETAKAGYSKDLQTGKLVRNQKKMQEEAILKLAPSGQAPVFDSEGNITEAKYRPEYLDVLKQKAAMDPFGLKRASAENAVKPKEYEMAAAGFGKRMEGADKKLQNLLQSGFDPSSMNAQAQGAMLMGPLESFKDPKLKAYEQAKRDFISAILRKESGAAISAGEYVEEGKKYFPQPGDGPDVLQQKTESRAQALANMQAQSGHAWQSIPSVPVGGLIKKKGLVGGGLVGGAPSNGGDTEAKIRRLNELKAKAAGQ